MPPGFDQLYSLWEDLALWLDKDEAGGRGTSTARSDPHFTNIGWPLSQCLLREADRRRLTEFFRSVGLEPRIEIEGNHLWALFTGWVHDGCGLTDHGLRVLRTAPDEVVQQLAVIIKREFDAWDGELRDSQGRRRGEIVLALDVAAGARRVVARFIARRPEEFPVGTWHSLDGDVELEPLGESWYQPLAFEPSRVLMDGGFSLTSAAFSLEYEPSRVIPLRASLDLGTWVSVRQATTFDPHCVIVANELLRSVTEFLGTFATPGWRPLENRGNLPRGWTIVTGVQITSAVRSAPPELRRLAPRLHTATSLEGGLQIAPRQYLAGGEPDLWLTVQEGADAELKVDGRSIPASEGVAEVALSELTPPLEPGAHEIVAGGIRRHFATLRGLEVTATPGTGALGHVFQRHGVYRPSSTEAGPIDPEGPPRGTVHICGASARALAADLPSPVQPPVLIPTGFHEYALVGAAPGEVLTLIPPAMPQWLEDLGLSNQVQFFDQPVAFTAQWLIVKGRLGTQVRPLATPPALPSRPQRALDEAPVAAWCAVIRDAHEDGASPVKESSVWDAYVERALEHVL